MNRDHYRRTTPEDFPEKTSVAGIELEKVRGLRYGWNPGYPAAWYREVGATGPCAGNAKIVQENPEKPIGYINMEDVDAGLRLVHKLYSVFGPKEYVAAVMKHVNPCGVARASSLAEAFERAWNCNSLSAFGGVVALSDIVDDETSRLLASRDRFVEVVVAPGYDARARERLACRKDLRVLEVCSLSQAVEDSSLELKRLRGGLLVQERYDSKITSPDKFTVLSARAPTDGEHEAALFNWLVCGFVRSNAIVIGNTHETVGIGTGQQSRIDSFRFAVWYAKERSKKGCKGMVAASDAFFPSTDCFEMAAQEGITAIAYTTGSIRDAKCIEVADRHNIALLTTGERCFSH